MIIWGENLKLLQTQPLPAGDCHFHAGYSLLLGAQESHNVFWRLFLLGFLAAVATIAVLASFYSFRKVSLYLLADVEAVCLDGSPAGYYFDPAADPKNANDWYHD